MPRLFAALELSPMLRERLGLVRGPLPGARWIEPDDMHVTLRFFGDIDNHVADELVSFLDQIDSEPVPLHVRGLGVFGGKEPRTLWAGIEPCGPLERLQRAIERAARQAGLEPEPRAFKPHVTLARLRNCRAPVLARFMGSRGSLDCAPITVDRFVLMSSRPQVGGAPYALEEAFTLSRPVAPQPEQA